VPDTPSFEEEAQIPPFERGAALRIVNLSVDGLTPPASSFHGALVCVLFEHSNTELATFLERSHSRAWEHARPERRKQLIAELFDRIERTRHAA